jgi:hypothetical protein
MGTAWQLATGNWEGFACGEDFLIKTTAKSIALPSKPWGETFLNKDQQITNC